MMIKYLLKNNVVLSLMKLLIIFFTINLIFIQNFNWISYNFSVGAYAKDLNANRIEYKLITIMDFNYDEIKYEDINDLYHKMNNDERIQLEYANLASGYLEMNKDCYINAYEPSFKFDSYPCILKPVNSERSFGYSVCGDNKFVEDNQVRFPIYKQETDPIILFEDVIEKEGYNHFFNSGSEIFITLDKSLEEDAQNYVDDYVQMIKDEFKKLGYEINFIVNKTDNITNAQEFNNNLYLEENKMQSLSFALIMFVSLITLVQIVVIKNKDIVATSLYLGKSKAWISLNLFGYLGIVDVIQVLIFIFSIKGIIESSSLKSLGFIDVRVVGIFILIGLLILDLLLALLSVYSLNSQKILNHLRNKEANQ